jgi:hypothetical protein
MTIRTTVSFDDDLLAEAKERAARTGHTLSEVVQDAMRLGFSRLNDVTHAPIDLLVGTSGGGPRPGVDLNNSAALLDLMESDE